MIKNKEKPFILVLEGNEASGKSTIAIKILNELQSKGTDVIYTREPGGVLVAEKIRNLILEDQEDGSTMEAETEVYLFAAARSEHIKKKIIPALEKGTSVIMDRYFYSSLAYQGVARGLGFNKVFNINHLVIKEAYPDLTLYLRVDPKERSKRLRERGLENRLDKESSMFLNKVDFGYRVCKRKFPEFIEIDANGSIDEVTRNCLEKMIESNII
jgi:dTMP kinase